MNELTGYVLSADDGEIGRCKDFLFDDQEWIVRYMVADTGKWIPDRRVLISPMSLGEPDWTSRRLEVDLTKDQIERAPGIEQDEPVSRQHQAALAAHYGIATYWPSAATWAPVPAEGVDIGTATDDDPASVATATDGDPHLRSFAEVQDYSILATDDYAGHVEDLIVDDRYWAVRYLVVDTRDWLPGRKVLISRDWITEIDWEKQEARVNLTPSQIEVSPEYDPTKPIRRAYETRLHQSYDRRGYWAS